MMAGCVRTVMKSVISANKSHKKVPAPFRHAGLYACYMYDNVPPTHSLHGLRHTLWYVKIIRQKIWLRPTSFYSFYSPYRNLVPNLLEHHIFIL